MDLFHNFWNQHHFLTRNMSYVYKEDDLSYEELHLKKHLVMFFKELGYVSGVLHLNESSRKRLKFLIKTWQLIDVNTKEERKVIFISS